MSRYSHVMNAQSSRKFFASSAQLSDINGNRLLFPTALTTLHVARIMRIWHFCLESCASPTRLPDRSRRSLSTRTRDCPLLASMLPSSCNSDDIPFDAVGSVQSPLILSRLSKNVIFLLYY
jgi:hypothetical protein